MKKEISEIPLSADLCYATNKGIILPENVPYLGMGTSFIATSVFRYLGINIFPEVASDYHNYLVKYKEPGNGVLISQSGETSETLWCADHFKSFLAIVNNSDSSLSRHEHCSKSIDLYAGKEDLISSKTYINTLLVLYLGFGFDPGKVIQIYRKELPFFVERGEKIGELLYNRIRWRLKKGIYIIASGPNVATANHAAIILGQVTKMPIVAIPAAQYDHAHKETAKNSLVIGINHEGPDFQRIKNILKTVKKAGGKIFELKRAMVESVFSPLTFSIPFIYAAHYLAERLKVENPFNIGDKVTLSEKDTDSKAL